MIKVWLAIATSALCLVTSAAAQEPAGSIRGKVIEPSGGVLPGVTIHLSSADGLVRDTTTDQFGAYVFEPLPSSTYTLTFELPGFVTASGSIVLSTGQAGRVDLTMAIGPFSEPSDCPQWHWLQSVSAGYVFAHQSDAQSSLPAGWIIGFAGGRSSTGFAWVGEASGNYRVAGDTDTVTPKNIFSALVGARKTVSPFEKLRFSLSGQILGGVSRINESSSAIETSTFALAVQPGVALQHSVSYNVDLRIDAAFQFLMAASGGHPADHGYRIAVSLVHQFPRWLCL